MPGLSDLRDRVALVTGASSGIGEQLARDLVAGGAKVALVARRADRLEALAQALGAARTLVVPADVSDRAAVEGAVAATHAHFGRLDLLVNAAGYVRHRLFKDEDVDEFARMMTTNYLGVVWAIRAALPIMRAQGAGWIMNLSSVAGRLGQPDEGAYSATKFAVTGLSEALTLELGVLGIHVLVVYPALVRTEMFPPETLARMPDRSFLEPAEFTRVVWRALARGAHEVTVPRWVGIAYLMRVVWPAMLRRQTAKLRFPKLPDLRS
ncbi:MAG: SDR family NAD(P)-dependent oxidoreductase [bacterium]|nr:SDR family NAD(P)-dependent oxidoreductase [bacterium]